MAERAEPRHETAQVLRLFPSFVWKARLPAEVFAAVNPPAIDQIQVLRRSLPALRPGQSWQSGHGLHEMEGFGGLIACIRAAATEVLALLEITHEGCEITGCWANVYARGAAHGMHSHPNNYLSGVYYVQVSEGANTINFHDPRMQTAILRPPVRQLTAENTDQVVVRVEEGTLLVFPAWLQHSVDANRGTRERISMSFNLMFSSYTDSMSRPLWSGA